MKSKKHIMRVVLIIGVIVIPLLYSFFYLKAFWDPYNTLSDLPVAVVNEDTGSTINGQQRNLGSEVVKQLKDSGKLKFITTDAKTAGSGVQGSKYYASITIPSNFSSNIATAETTDKKNATIYYQVNQKHNYIASQVLGKVVLQIEENVRGNIGKEITDQLTKQLGEIPSQLKTLSSGLGQIQSGANQLSSGSKTLADGQNTLTVNLKALDSGLTIAQSGSTSLTTGLSSLDSGLGQALSGSNQLNTALTGSSGALSTLTSAFSALNSGAQQLSTSLSKSSTYYQGMQSVNTGAQALSSAFAKSGKLYLGIQNVNKAVQALDQQFAASGGSTNLYNGIKGVDAGVQQLNQQVAALSTLSTGLTDLDTNLHTLNSSFSSSGSIYQGMKGTAALASGTTSYVSSVNGVLEQLIQSPTTSDAEKAQYQALINAGTNLEGSANQISALSSAADTLQTSIAQLTAGADALASHTSDLQKLQTGVQQLATATSALSSGVDTLQKQLISPLSSGSSQLSAAADTLKGQTATLAAATSQLLSATGELSSGAAQLASGTGQLVNNSSQLNVLQTSVGRLAAALGQLKNGSSQLLAGSTQLQSGLTDAKSGSSQLVSGSEQLTSGATSLNSGASELSSGVTTAKTQVDSNTSDAATQLKKTTGLGDYAEKSVSVSEKDVNAISNYGTGFAPYFMSLSLWVGALLVFFGIYLDADERIKLLSRHSPNKLFRIGAFVLIGIAQALALALIVHYGLGLKISNAPAFYLSCILVSIVFISIVEFLIVNLKDIGKFLSLLFLILQLTSNGGTFPMETVPKFFNVLYPFMPMTYSVRLFKETITNYSGSGAASDVAVLLCIFAVFTFLTILFSVTRKAKAKLQIKAGSPS